MWKVRQHCALVLVHFVYQMVAFFRGRHHVWKRCRSWYLPGPSASFDRFGKRFASAQRLEEGQQEGRGRTYQRCLLWTRQRSAIEPMNSARRINQSQNNPVERIFNLSTGQNFTHARPIKSSKVTAPQLRESLLD